MAEQRTFQIVGKKCIVTHKTITADNDKGIWFTWTLDFSKVTPEQMMKWAADQRVIALRASTGVKKLTSAEVETKGLLEKEFDLSQTVERVKHVETPQEKALREAINGILAKNKNLNMDAVAAKLRELAAMTEEENMDAGEQTA